MKNIFRILSIQNYPLYRLFLLLPLLVACQPVQHIPITTPTLTPPVESGRIFFVRTESVQSGYVRHFDNLWVVTLDGARQRQVTFDAPPGIGYAVPVAGASVLVFASATPVLLDTDQVRQVLVPAACQVPRFDYWENSRIFDFSFSPDGRYLAFRVGDYGCAASILRLLDIEQGTCFDVEGYDKMSTWLPDNRALVAMVSCEGGGYGLYDLATKSVRYLGYGSFDTWNRDKTAFYASQRDYIGWSDVMWAYNVQHDVFIHQLPQRTATTEPLTGGLREFPLGWTPEGEHLLYTSRWISYTANLSFSLPFATTFGPEQLYVVDSRGQQRRALIDDSTHSYFLQGRDGSQLLIQKIPYQVFSIPFGPVDWDLFGCQLGGRDCPDSEYFLLDWQTGELTPWPQAVLSTPTPMPAAPDLYSRPVYVAPDGRYALYTALNGEGLWQVFASGEQVLLVTDGHHFVYVGEP